MHSRELTSAGRLLLAHNMILDCWSQNSPPTPALSCLCDTLGLDTTHLLSQDTLRRLVWERRSALWETQKKCEQLHYGWLEQVTQGAHALEDPDRTRPRTMSQIRNSAPSPRVLKGRRIVSRFLLHPGTGHTQRQRYIIMAMEFLKHTQRLRRTVTMLIIPLEFLLRTVSGRSLI